MSVESAKAFIERMKTDAEFAKLAKEQKNKEQILAFIKKVGYEFKEEECIEAIKAIDGSELSDASLDNVVGGGEVIHLDRATLFHWIDLLRSNPQPMFK